MTSSNQLRKSGGIPTEIEIINHENVADDEKFQIDLDATAENERCIPSVPCQETPGKNKNNIKTENKTAPIESKPSASMDSSGSSLEWAAGISLESPDSEMPNHPNQEYDEMVVLHQHRNETPNLHSGNNSHLASSTKVTLRQSVDSHHSDDITNSLNDYDHSPSIPNRVTVGHDFDGDDMSLLQCTPLHNVTKAGISSRFKPKPVPLPNEAKSTLIQKGGQDETAYEEHSTVSAASHSYASFHSGLSHASRRSLHPLLPLCSLQNLQAIKASQQSMKKRKKEPKLKRGKRSRTNQTIPVSA
jgi:hypothetical protein